MGNLGKIIVATSFEWLPKVQKSPNLVTLGVSTDHLLFSLLIAIMSPEKASLFEVVALLLFSRSKLGSLDESIALLCNLWRWSSNKVTIKFYFDFPVNE